MKTIHASNEPVLDDWIAFLQENTSANSRKNDYAWLLDLNCCARMLLADECSPVFRDEIIEDLGHSWPRLSGVTQA